MILYVAKFDFYHLMIGIFSTKEKAIEAARKRSDSWVEMRMLNDADEVVVETVWRHKDNG